MSDLKAKQDRLAVLKAKAAARQLEKEAKERAAREAQERRLGTTGKTSEEINRLIGDVMSHKVNEEKKEEESKTIVATPKQKVELSIVHNIGEIKIKVESCWQEVQCDLGEERLNKAVDSDSEEQIETAASPSLEERQVLKDQAIKQFQQTLDTEPVVSEEKSTEPEVLGKDDAKAIMGTHEFEEFFGKTSRLVL